MARATSITVDVNVTIPDSTIVRCLRILEMWLDDNPDKQIIVDTIVTTTGYAHRLTIEDNATKQEVDNLMQNVEVTWIT